MSAIELASRRTVAGAARAFAALIGAGEAAAGLVLLARPSWMVQALHLAPPPPEAAIFLRWIGVFVLATGLAYLLPWTRPAGEERDLRLRVALEWTSAARLLVASFVAVADLAGELPLGWCAVGAYDGVVACVQLAWLARGGYAP